MRLQVQHDPGWVLQAFLHAHEERDSLATIDDTMIVRQREIHHWPSLDLAAYDNRAFLNLVHAQNTRLWCVQNRGRHQGSIDAAVADGESAALHFIDLQSAIARPPTKIDDCLFDLCKRHVIGIANNRHDQTLLGADRYTDMIIIPVDDVGAVDLGVHGRDLLQCLNAGADKEAHEPELHTVLFFKQIPVLCAQRHDSTHIDLVEGREHGGGVLCILQAARNGLTQSRHVYALFAGSIIGGRWCAHLHRCRYWRWGRRCALYCIE